MDGVVAAADDVEGGEIGLPVGGDDQNCGGRLLRRELLPESFEEMAGR